MHFTEQYGQTVNPECIVVTTGLSAGFLLSFLVLFDPGGRMAIAAPGYPARGSACIIWEKLYCGNWGVFLDANIGYPDAATIDASAMTNGGIEAYISDGVVENAVVKGGQGGDRIGGSDGNDTIQGNGGNDTIYSDKGTDILSGGTGADKFVYDVFPYYSGQGEFLTGLTVGDTITDFTPRVDKLVFSNGLAVINASAQQAAVQAAVSALGTGSTPAQIAIAMAMTNTTDNAVAFAASGGNTYVYYEKFGGATGVPAIDVFIKLVGVTAGLTLTVVPSNSFLPPSSQ